MAKAAENGQSEAHTRADAGGIDADPALPGADPLALLDGSPDLDASDLLAMAAEPALTQRRARGRPEGAANRKNADMIAYLRALGHRDPWVTLSLIQSADTAKLADFLGAPLEIEGVVQRDVDGNVKMVPADRLKVATLQKAAADTIMPYHHGKKPLQLDMLGDGKQRPFMVIGEMNVAIVGENGFMSAGEPPMKTVDNQQLSEPATVRPNGDESHDDAK